MGKKKNSKYRAQRAMWAGATATLFGLLVLPLALRNMPLTYSANTGVVGDTIGGIAGPILNFTGLVVVYYSLREQFKANQQQARQIKGEVERARNERYFDLTFRLVEKLEASVEKEARAYDTVAALFRAQEISKTSVKSQGSDEILDLAAEELRRIWWVFHDLWEHFQLLQGQLGSSVLKGEQKLVLANLIDIGYGRRLKSSRVKFQQEYQSGFERDDTKRDTRPDFLKHIDDRLVEIYELQEAAKRQVAIERIPYGETQYL